MTRQDQIRAYVAIVEAVLDTIKASPDGAPGGHLYAALMHHGCSLEQFESIMHILVASGRVRKSGHVYHCGEPKS